MDLSSLALYVEDSPFVQEYAVGSGGVDDSLPGSDVVSSPERVVVCDALLRRHYVWLDVEEVVSLTGLSEGVISDCVGAFVDAGLVIEVDGEYQVDSSDERVQGLREEQVELL